MDYFEGYSFFFSCVSLEVAGIVAADARGPQLLDQYPDHVDEDDEVHLRGTDGEMPRTVLLIPQDSGISQTAVLIRHTCKEDHIFKKHSHY